jgi:hypothetical protein
MGRRARCGRDTCRRDQLPRFEKPFVFVSLAPQASFGPKVRRTVLRLSSYSAFEGNDDFEFDSSLTSENKAALFSFPKKRKEKKRKEKKRKEKKSKVIISNHQI